MSFARLVLGLSGLAFLAIGVPCLLDPSLILTRAGIGIDGPLADGDLRAVYGGLQIALAGLLFRGAWQEPHAASALTLQQVTFGGLVVGRLVGIAVRGLPGGVGLTLLGFEAVGLVAGALARRRLAFSAPRA